MVDGSSPRMWGTHRGPGCPALLARFIPTHVGNTWTGTQPVTPISVHPHACGEHISITLRMDRSAGSSPRMWGTLPLCHGGRSEERFIPTHVGNTRVGHVRGEETAVHPHACGEHLFRRSIISYPGGSSPRMWGTHLRGHWLGP